MNSAALGKAFRPAPIFWGSRNLQAPSIRGWGLPKHVKAQAPPTQICMEDNQIIRTVLLNWLNQARILIDLVIIAWMVSAANFWLLGKSLNRWGVRPRVLGRLWMIPFHAFLHGDWQHLEGNTFYFLLFGGLILLRDSTDFNVVSWVTLFASGLGIWLFGKTFSNHIGASGVIFGYFGFLLTLGYFDKNLSSMLLTGIGFFFYGYMLWGLLPLRKGISWEGHLFGFLGGVLAARHLPYLKELFERLGDALQQIGRFLV
jgi:membrane associated rhomboid family serine protease